ncbi:hypothetical protein HOLleu_40262 [Holothuria leucospilota]|uniref:Uncharacterized protein n=1 Tax=Holothuria leucospilota TaxID=206669 RepID=A0A9Q0YHI3_HOLLE|nr:hypothetical protein HOLleu_40262 [Holothuria leucospilota]
MEATPLSLYYSWHMYMAACRDPNFLLWNAVKRSLRNTINACLKPGTSCKFLLMKFKSIY